MQALAPSGLLITRTKPRIFSEIEDGGFKFEVQFEFIIAPEERNVYSTKQDIVISLRKERHALAQRDGVRRTLRSYWSGCRLREHLLSIDISPHSGEGKGFVALHESTGVKAGLISSIVLFGVRPFSPNARVCYLLWLRHVPA